MATRSLTREKPMDLRRKLVAGNWKMNGSLAVLAELSAIAEAARQAGGVDVAICPPFTLIAAAMTRSGGLIIGGQDCHWEQSGPHTGHSESRSERGDSDSVVRDKAAAALAQGLQTIVCLGESDAERRAGDQVPTVVRQLEGSLPDDWREGELVLAYEPIWAIGTGKVATATDVGEMHAAIRAALVSRYGERGDRVRILYGGSVKAENAAELFAVADVDGALVGGASLTAEQFVPIILAAAAS